MQSFSPVQTKERETFMDVLRGFAILGIFIANLAGFSHYNSDSAVQSPFIVPSLDFKMAFWHHVFIEGKFYSIFSLLFGWGIALQFKRAEASNLNALPTIVRRLLFMLLLGACHLLLWSGDIVFFYALLGFILIPLRKFSDKKMLITGVVLILSPMLLYAAKMRWPWLNAPAQWLFSTGQKVDTHLNGISSEEDYRKYIAHAGWIDIIRTNIAGVFFRYGHLFFISRISKVLGMFLIGYVVGRSDFYKNIAKNKRIVLMIIAGGLLVGLPANYMLAHYMEMYDADYYSLKQNGLYQTIAYALGVAPLCLAYVGCFMLLFQNGIGKKILSVLAPVGKMAFSNYILQTLIGSFVFLAPGLGYGGKIGPFYYTLFGVMFFCCQIIISTVWLKFFNYGPLEWLWRSATYKNWQTLKKQ